jgi:hypothetical protein
VGSGVVLRAARGHCMGVMPSCCRRGYPWFRVPTVAPGPASGEDVSLQVGPESDWWLDCCFRAPAAAITVVPPMTTPTSVPIPTADWPVTVVLNGTVWPCAGCLESLHCFWKIYLFRICDSPEKTKHWRRRRCGFFAHGNRRRLHDVWAWALSWTASRGRAEGSLSRGAFARFSRGGSPLWPLVTTKMKGRLIVGRLHAPCATIRLPDRWLPRKRRGA